jgi:hypothetical protein
VLQGKTYTCFQQTLVRNSKLRHLKQEAALPKIGQHTNYDSPRSASPDSSNSPFKSKHSGNCSKPGEDKSVNLFYLRDVLLKPDADSQLQKIKAIATIKLSSRAPVFKTAIEPLLTPVAFKSFCSDIFMQQEILHAVGTADHFAFQEPLKLLLLSPQHPAVARTIRATIHCLQTQQTSQKNIGPANEQSRYNSPQRGSSNKAIP